MQPSHPSSFGILLKRLRKEAGLTQEELAERAGLTAKAISALECDTRHPRRDTSQRLIEALHLTGPDQTIFKAAARGKIIKAPLPLPKTLSFPISHDWLVVGDRTIRWIVLGRAKYTQESLRCSYSPTPVPLIPAFERMLNEYQRDWEKRRQSGETNLPYNSGMYKLTSFHVGYRRVIEGSEVPELLLAFAPTDYFTQIITELNVDSPVRRHYAAATDITEQPVPEFASIVGINLSLITSDQYLLVTQRSKQAFVAKEGLHISVGENMLRPTDSLSDGTPHPFATATRGIMEEVGVTLREDDISFSAFGCEPHLCQYALMGTIFLKESAQEIVTLRQKGTPKDKWESRQFIFVPYDLKSVARFTVKHWNDWFPTGLAAVVMSLLDAGYSAKEIDDAFAQAGADEGFSRNMLR